MDDSYSRPAGAGLGRTLALCVALGIGFVATPVEAGPPNKDDKGDKDKRPAERVSERVSRGALDEGLDTLDDDVNRERLGRVLNSPEMNDAVHDLAASFVTGAVDGVATAQTDNATAKAIGKGLDRHISPAVGRLVERAVVAAIETGLTDAHIRRVELLSEQASRAAIRGIAKGLEEDLGPAMALTLERDLLPAMARGLDTPEMQRVVAGLTRSVAAEFVGGAGDAIDGETQTKGTWKMFGGQIARGYAVALFVSIAFGTLLIGLTAFLFINSRRLRKESLATGQREAALLTLIDRIEADHPELQSRIRKMLSNQLEA